MVLKQATRSPLLSQVSFGVLQELPLLAEDAEPAVGKRAERIGERAKGFSFVRRSRHSLCNLAASSVSTPVSRRQLPPVTIEATLASDFYGEAAFPHPDSATQPAV